MDAIPRLFNQAAAASFRYPTTVTPMRRRFMELERLIGHPQRIHRFSLMISSPTSPERRTSVTTTHTHTTHVEEVINMSGSISGTINATMGPEFPPHPGTAGYRRYIYEQDLWVLPYGNGDTSRFRDASARSYKENTGRTHRLIPWLNRELLALLSNPYEVEDLLPKIIRAIHQHDITSREFKLLVEPYMLQNTRHFIHEFHNFARSCFDIEGYTRNARYVTRDHATIAVAHATDDEMSDSDSISVTSSSSDRSSVSSYIEVLSPTPLSAKPTTPMSPDDHSIIDVEDNSETSEAIDSILASSDSGIDSLNINMIDDFDNPAPGPSGIRTNKANSSQIIPPPAVDNEDTDTEIDVGIEESNSVPYDVEAKNNDSDDSIEIVGYKKPLAERTPEVIELSSSEESDHIDVDLEKYDLFDSRLSEVKFKREQRGVSEENKSNHRRKHDAIHSDVSCSSYESGRHRHRSSHRNGREKKRKRKSKSNINAQNVGESDSDTDEQASLLSPRLRSVATAAARKTKKSRIIEPPLNAKKPRLNSVVIPVYKDNGKDIPKPSKIKILA